MQSRTVRFLSIAVLALMFASFSAVRAEAVTSV